MLRQIAAMRTRCEDQCGFLIRTRLPILVSDAMTSRVHIALQELGPIGIAHVLQAMREDGLVETDAIELAITILREDFGY